jgi:hypothetical protein
VESRSLFNAPDSAKSRLSLATRAAFRIFAQVPKMANAYRLNLFAGKSQA